LNDSAGQPRPVEQQACHSNSSRNVPIDGVRRVLVIGASGSGKTTLSKALSARLGVEWVELDALYHGPNWTHPPEEEFRERILAIAARDAWIIDGNYTRFVGDALHRAADTIVWIDLPLAQTLVRLARRSATRYLARAELWNGNREALRGWFWGWDSLFPWTFQRHRAYRRDLPEKFRGEAYASKSVHRLRSQHEIDAFLARVQPSESASG
jgi:adenylate kinase family enzyme